MNEIHQEPENSQSGDELQDETGQNLDSENWSGHELKRKRKAQDITLEEMSERTKIRKKYLEAIEEGKFEIMPGQVYCLGFIRTYAQEVGLKPDELVAKYHQYMNQSASDSSSQDMVNIDTDQDAEKSRSYMLYLTAGAGLLLLLAVAINIYIGNIPGIELERNSGEPLEETLDSENAPQISLEGDDPLTVPPTYFEEATVDTEPQIYFTVKDSPDEASVQEEEESKPASSENGIEHPEEEIPTPLELAVEITDTSWLRITADQEVLFEGTLERGETRSWEADANFTVRTGNAGGVRLILNDVDMGPMGKSGEVKEESYSEPPE